MLIKDSTIPVFDTTEVPRGSVVCARREGEEEWISGIVTEVTEHEIRIQYLPLIQNVLNHALIRACDVAAGYWEVRYSNDALLSVGYCFVHADESGDDPDAPADGGGEGTGDGDGTQTEGSHDSEEGI